MALLPDMIIISFSSFNNYRLILMLDVHNIHALTLENIIKDILELLLFYTSIASFFYGWVKSCDEIDYF